MKTLTFLSQNAPLHPHLAQVVKQKGWHWQPGPTEEQLSAYLARTGSQVLIWEINPAEDWEAALKLRPSLQARVMFLVFLTPPISPEERKALLVAGADRVWERQEPMEELAARLGALLRQAERQGRPQVDDVHYSLICQGQAIQFTPMEYRLVHFLAQNLNQRYTAEALLAALWPDLPPKNTALVRNHIKNVRGKLQKHGHPPYMLEGRYREGYALRWPST